MKIRNIIIFLLVLFLIPLSCRSSGNESMKYFIIQEKVYIFNELSGLVPSNSFIFIKFIKTDDIRYSVEVYNYDYQMIEKYIISNYPEKILLNEYIKYSKNGEEEKAKILNNLFIDKDKLITKLNLKISGKKYEFLITKNYKKNINGNNNFIIAGKINEKNIGIALIENFGLAVYNYEYSGTQAVSYSVKGAIPYSDFNIFRKIYQDLGQHVDEVSKETAKEYGMTEDEE